MRAPEDEVVLQELRVTMFDKLADFMEAVGATIMAEGAEPNDIITAPVWVRSDGVSLMAKTARFGEVQYTVQVPADDIVSR